VRYTNIFETDITLSAIGLGCEALGGTDWGIVDLDDAAATVRTAWDHGVVVFDTADVYGLGQSERRLAAALGKARHDAVIVSKFGVRWRGTANSRAVTWRDATPDYVVDALESSLRRLRVERIPIYLVHWPDAETPIEETLGALEEQRLAGKIGVYGVSNFADAQLKKAVESGGRVAEMPLNLIQRGAESDISFCGQHDVSVLAYGPYAQGLLCGRYGRHSKFEQNDRRHRLPHFAESAWDSNDALLERLKVLANQRGVKEAQVALQWVISHPPVACTLVGARNPEQLLDTLSLFASDAPSDDRFRSDRCTAGPRCWPIGRTSVQRSGRRVM
jgi:aryl-alcohol dehydrogenase-like predicted oxidoreductase